MLVPIQQYAMTAEISSYTEVLNGTGTGDKMAELAIYAGNGILSFGNVIISFMIGAICMFTVPSISTWIISTSGISSAASTFGRSEGTVTRAARIAAGAF